MKKLVCGAALALAVALSGTAFAQQKESIAHMDHVLKSWNDTPDKMGFLATADAEAAVAMTHINLAMAKPGDLDSIRLHLGHVLNALDPSAMAKGPGLGYGVKKAAAGVAAHIGFAAKAGDASENVKLHAVHVSASANNVVHWVDEAVAMAERAKGQSSAESALAEAKKVQAMLIRVVEGFDANKDGAMGWQEGEGALKQAGQHMGFMAKGEADS